jgi:hypothetical protein
MQRSRKNKEPDENFKELVFIEIGIAPLRRNFHLFG